MTTCIGAGSVDALARRVGALKMADEKTANLKQAIEGLEKQIAALKAEAGAVTSPAQMADRLAKVESALSEIRNASTAIEGVLHARETGSDTARIEGQVH
jgi:hypothetical protein